MKKRLYIAALSLPLLLYFATAAKAFEVANPADEILKLVNLERQAFNYIVSIAKSNEYEALTRLNLKNRERVETMPGAIESAVIYSSGIPAALAASFNNLNSRPVSNVSDNAAILRQYRDFQAAVLFDPNALPGEGKFGSADSFSQTAQAGHLPGKPKTVQAGKAGAPGKTLQAAGNSGGRGTGTGNTFGNRAAGPGGWGAAALAASMAARNIAATARAVGFGARGQSIARGMGANVGMRVGASLGARGSGLKGAASFGASAGARAGKGLL